MYWGKIYLHASVMPLLWKSASKRMGNQPYSSWGKQQTGWGDQPQQNTWSQHINNQAGKPTSTI